jgi:hypothetical protein
MVRIVLEMTRQTGLVLWRSRADERITALRSGITSSVLKLLAEALGGAWDTSQMPGT